MQKVLHKLMELQKCEQYKQIMIKTRLTEQVSLMQF